MARQSAWLMGAAGAALIVCVAVVLIATSSAQRGADDEQTHVWNDFTLPQMPPSSAQVAQLTTSAPDAERATSAARISRVLRPGLLPQGFADHLLPLRGWAGGNVFVLRQTRGADVIQATEGARKILVEIRKADGSPMVDRRSDLSSYARSVAEYVLAANMQPREFHAIGPTEEPGSLAVAGWITHGPAQDGLALSSCRAYSDGAFVRYEFRERMLHSAELFAAPAPYLFGAPPPERTPIRKREVETPKPRKPNPADWQGEIKAELTPEELANEVN